VDTNKIIERLREQRGGEDKKNEIELEEGDEEEIEKVEFGSSVKRLGDAEEASRAAARECAPRPCVKGWRLSPLRPMKRLQWSAAPSAAAVPPCESPGTPAG
jgi:hypothetical protein